MSTTAQSSRRRAGRGLYRVRNTAMRVLYVMTSGTSDPTRASLPVHLAVNGSAQIGDQPEIFMAGDATEWVADPDAIPNGQGVGVPSMSEIFAKLREHEVPVWV